MHYQRWQKHGDVSVVKLGMREKKNFTCTITGCSKPATAKRMCGMHYARWLRHGDSGRSVREFGGSLLERFLQKVSWEKTAGCWYWKGAVSGSFPYGVLWIARSRSVMAHRLAYELFVGPIPPGLEIDHVCHSRDLTCPGGPSCPHRLCVRPDHLEAVTHQENVRRGRSCTGGELIGPMS